MDNIDLLLESLDSQFEQNDTGEENFPANTPDENQACGSSQEDIEDNCLSKDPEFQKLKKGVSTKYSNYGYEIHKQLKEKARSSHDSPRGSTTTWKSKSTEKPEQGSLSAPQPLAKSDVYAEPIFGLRLV